MLQQTAQSQSPALSPETQSEKAGPDAKGSNQKALQAAGFSQDAVQPPSDPGNLAKTLKEMGPTGTVVLDAIPLKQSLKVARMLRDVPWVGTWLSENDTDKGNPLPGDVRKMAEQSYGMTFGDVTIRKDSEADKMASQKGFAAFTDGHDIYLSTSASGEELSHILLHELAHVAAGRGQSPSAKGSASEEQDADEAAVAAARGEKARIKKASKGVRGFTPPGHERSTETAFVENGHTEEEAKEAYKANWERDWSALIVPTFEPIQPILLLFMDLDCWSKFGEGVDIENLGAYDPVAHLDNPSGMDAGTAWDPSTSPTANNHQLADTGNTGWSLTDPRYPGFSGTPGIANQKEQSDAFMVNEDGLVNYMTASQQMMIEKTKEAGRQRSENPDISNWRNAYEDADHLGQDFFAHSNFCEIATNILIQDGKVAGASEPIDTGVHGINSDGTIQEENLKTDNGREVLATSTYTSDDGIHSVEKFLKDKVMRFKPFEEGATPRYARTLALWAESNPSYLGNLAELPATIGRSFAANVCTPVDKALEAQQTWAAENASIEQSVVQMGGDLVVGGLQGAAGVASLVGADKTSTSLSAESYEVQGTILADTLQITSDQCATYTEAAEVRTRLAELQQKLEEPGSLVALVDLLFNESAELLALHTWAAQLPFFGSVVVETVKKWEEIARNILAQAFEFLWKKLVDIVFQFIDLAVSAYTGRTEVAQDPSTPGLTAQSMTMPSHTTIAKDFDEGGVAMEDGDMHQGAIFSAMAEELATLGSKDRLEHFEAWDGSEEGFTDVKASIDRWFQHPEDNRNLWEATVMKHIQSNPELNARLTG